jgi:hypothetical protein
LEGGQIEGQGRRTERGKWRGTCKKEDKDGKRIREGLLEGEQTQRKDKGVRTERKTLRQDGKRIREGVRKEDKGGSTERG